MRILLVAILSVIASGAAAQPLSFGTDPRDAIDQVLRQLGNTLGPVAVCRPPMGSGPTLAALGNSNTQPWQPWVPWADHPLLAAKFTIENCGWGGATATSPNPLNGQPYFSGLGQLAASSSEYVVIGFVTNDLGQGISPEDTVAAVLDVYNAAGPNAFVMNGPPRTDPPGALIPATNALLAAALPSGRLIDVYTGMDQYFDPPACGLTCIHFSEAGQGERARRVLIVVPEPPVVLQTKSALAVVALIAACVGAGKERAPTVTDR